jgi:hypothetical protein
MDRLIATIALLVAAPAAAQPVDAEHAALLKTVDAAFAAISAQDETALSVILLPGAIFYRESIGEDGKPRTAVIPSPAMLERMKGPKRELSELRTGAPTVLVRNGLAQVWTPYTFDVAGKRSHCGIDTISLLKVDGAWRIASFGWTAEPQGCSK